MKTAVAIAVVPVAWFVMWYTGWTAAGLLTFCVAAALAEAG